MAVRSLHQAEIANHKKYKNRTLRKDAMSPVFAKGAAYNKATQSSKQFDRFFRGNDTKNKISKK